jgi:hypothetical protein
MKLRFDVDQAACVRAGIGQCDPTVIVEVDAARIKLDVRNLIADRLIGNDVCQLWNSEKGTSKSVDFNGHPVRLVAEAPTFEALVKAVQKDAQIVQARRSCHRAIALVRANSLEESKPVQPSPDTSRFFKAAAGVMTSVAPAQAAHAVTVNGNGKAAAVAGKVKKPRKKRIPMKRVRKKKATA